MKGSGLLAMAAVVAVGGCANLSVTVDVLDPSYPAVAAHDAALIGAASMLASGNMSEPGRVAAQLNLVRRDAMRRCFDEWIRLEKLGGGSGDALLKERDATLMSFNQGLTGEFAADQSALASLDAAALTAIGASGKIADFHLGSTGVNGGNAGGAMVLPAELKTAMIVRETGYLQYLQWRKDQYLKCPARAIGGQQFSVDLGDIPADANAVVKSVDHIAYTSNIGGGRLLFDQKEAYFVAQAPPQFWALEYNRALGDGKIGGTDIVVKLNDTADFTIKGMVFDSRSTANMIKKVGTSVLSVLAASQGMGALASVLPKADPTPGAPTAPAATGSKPAAPDAAMQSVATAEAEQAVAAAVARNFDAQLMRTANHILGSWDQLLVNNSTSKKSIKDSFEAGKKVATGEATQ